MFAYARTLKQFGWVGINFLLQGKKTIERTDAAQHPGYAACLDATLSQFARKLVEHFQSDVAEVDIIVGIIDQEFLQVPSISIERILGVGALQTQILDVSPHDRLIHNSHYSATFHQLCPP